MKKLLLSLSLAGIAMSASAADLAPSCQKYFEEYEGMLKAMPQAQVDAYKQQYEAAKQQFAALPTAAQDQSCTQALEQLKQSKAAMGIK
ncbi:TonB-dependent receptor [Gallibacterium salpingitidis]|uniref:TonB-dependent receptor n=1 Tax=Gallibacterium salpingitidis TaxID=505341 RepID=A0A1A7Q8R3_9PAST|nr:DUF5339 family protein [Gallibacterium salpingitidis]OBW92137.1 TonB-dependent receptor [Gallibacterium salpingitidis]OBX08030.1 TonB-dependent receptor [Gallibacterium salpingitidis]OBX11268.1 TonB-dependent receptor [Gallibacterium salpingitidis]